MHRTPRRRWFAFNLRTLFIVVTLVAMIVAWVAHERMESHRQLAIVAARGDHAYDVELGGPFDDAKLTPEQQSWWRKLATAALGPRVQSVMLHGRNQDRAQLSDLSPISALTDLQELQLNGAPVSNLYPLIALTSLRALDLSGTQVSDLEPIKGFTRLQSLDITSAPVRSLAPLAGLESLEVLCLSGTPVSDISALFRLQKLHTLHLEYTHVSDLAPLVNLGNLQTLHLDGAPVADVSPLSGLTNLRRVILYETQTRDVAPLIGLTNLKWLCLHSTRVSKEQVADLRRALPNCWIVVGDMTHRWPGQGQLIPRMHGPSFH